MSICVSRQNEAVRRPVATPRGVEIIYASGRATYLPRAKTDASGAIRDIGIRLFQALVVILPKLRENYQFRVMNSVVSQSVRTALPNMPPEIP